MKTAAVTAIVMTAALLVPGGASAQQFSYSYDAWRYGGTSTITSKDGRGGVSARKAVTSVASRMRVLSLPGNSS